MSNKIVKSSILLQKETELKALEKRYKKVIRNLKSNKTRLKNDKAKIAEIQREMALVMQEQQLQLVALQAELLEAVKKVKNSKKVPKEDKGNFAEMFEDIKSQTLSEEEIQKMTEEFAEQRAHAEYEKHLFEKFHQIPSADDQKAIRKIYIQLSKQFHPDLAHSEQERTRFSKIMVQINQAYQAGDVQELLRLQKNMKSYKREDHDFPIEQNAVISILQEKINIKANELHLLEGQLERSRLELSKLRNSEEGILLSDYKYYQKSGFNLVAEMEEETMQKIESLKAIIENLNEFAKTGEFNQEFLFAMSANDPFLLFSDDDDDDDDDDLDFDYFMDIFVNGN